MSISRNCRLVFAVTSLAVSVILAPPSAVHAATAMFTAGTTAEQSVSTIQIGSRFQVVHPVITTAIGAYVPTVDRNGDNTTKVDFTGVLYSLSGDKATAGSYTVLETVLIPAGTTFDSNHFAYASFSVNPSYTLAAGSQYVVTAWHGSPSAESGYNWLESVGSPAGVDPNITWLNTQYILGSTGKPTSFNLTTNDFGGNLQITAAPEPATLCLMAIGGLCVLRRNRAQAA